MYIALGQQSDNLPFMTEPQEASILSAEESSTWQITSPGEEFPLDYSETQNDTNIANKHGGQISQPPSVIVIGYIYSDIT